MAAGGVVIRRTFSAGAGRRGLESAAQFSTGCIVIGGTVCRAASFIQVVILRTIPGRRRWNPPHSLRRAGLLSAAQFLCGAQRGAKNSGCYRAHNSDFVCGRQVVIYSTICAVWKIDYCYRQHNSPVRDFGFLPFFLLLFCAHFTICRTSAGLLSAAQFAKKGAFTPVYYCYTRHNSKNLFSGVVICGTF